MKVICLFCSISLILVLAASISSCKSAKSSTCDIPETTAVYKWENAIIHSSPFTDKAGREHPEIRDYFLIIKDGDYFIKLSECKATDLKNDQLTGHLVKVKVKIKDGLWDTNDPNIQSRVGSYAVIDSIQDIGIPVGFILGDGNGNKYTISRNMITYDPVLIMESSSGQYSGGDEKKTPIDLDTFYSLIFVVYDIYSNSLLHINHREMGSYLLNLELKEKNLVKNIANCEQAKVLKDRLDKLLITESE